MSSSLYRFTFSGTNVSAIQEFDDGLWKTENKDSNEIWFFDTINSTVTKTETENGYTKTLTYVPYTVDGTLQLYGADQIYKKTTASTS